MSSSNCNASDIIFILHLLVQFNLTSKVSLTILCSSNILQPNCLWTGRSCRDLQRDRGGSNRYLRELKIDLDTTTEPVTWGVGRTRGEKLCCTNPKECQIPKKTWVCFVCLGTYIFFHFKCEQICIAVLLCMCSSNVGFRLDVLLGLNLCMCLNEFML